MEEPRDERVEGGKELDRIAFFSDAFFAIVMTLLVLDIQVPEGLEASQVREAILGELPKIGSFALSFAVIATFWAAHHRMFRYIRHFDARLIWLNFLFLFFIAFLPFSSSLLGEYGDEWTSFAIYCVTMIFTGLSLTFLWVYATYNRRFVAGDLDRSVILSRTRGGLVVPLVFLASLIVSLFDTSAGEWTILAGFVLWSFAVRVYSGYKSRGSTEEG